MRPGLIIGICSGMLWGLNDVFTNLFSYDVAEQINHINDLIIFSLGLAFMQDLFSSSMLTGFHAITGQFPRHFARSSAVVWVMVFAGLFAGPFGMVAGIMGIAYAGPVYAGVITSCYPVVALVFGVLIVKDSINFQKVAGILVAVCAVVLISIQGAEHESENLILGMLFATIAMLGWGLESVLFSYAYIKTGLPPTWLLGIRQFSSTSAYFLILIGLVIAEWHEVWRLLAQMADLPMIAACLLTAMFSYIAYYLAIRQIGPSLGTIFNATFIFWAAVISMVIGISVLKWSFWLWAVMLIAGMCLALTADRPRKPDQAEPA